jgi:hypothetical protein
MSLRPSSSRTKKPITKRQGGSALLSFVGLSKPIILGILVLASTLGVYLVYNASASTSPQTVRDRILANAQLYLGMHETPDGCNCGGKAVGGVNIGTFTQHTPGEPWCADFVSYMYWKSGFPFIGPAGDPNYQRTASANGILNWFKSHGHFYPRTANNANNYPPLWGDVMFYADPASGSGAQHVGIYSGKNNSGSIFSVDGNWANGVNYDQTTNWKNNSVIIGWGRIDAASN